MAMILATGARAVYTMSLPSSCDIELDSPILPTKASMCGRAMSQMPWAAMHAVPSSNVFVVSAYAPFEERVYPSCSSVINRRRAVGRGETGASGHLADRELHRRRPERLDHVEAACQRLDEVAAPVAFVGRALLGVHPPVPIHVERERAMSTHPSHGPDGDNSRGPLDGLIVADLSRVLAGPYCSMLLADLGATVVKVEGAGG